MKKRLFIINIIIIVLSTINITFINMKTKDKIRDYSFMIASKITKYIVNNAYIREKINYYIDDIYEIVKDNSDEIKNVVYNSKKINELINSVTERVYEMFNMLEYGDMEKLNIRENILSIEHTNNKGIVLEVPCGLITNNYLLNNLGPHIPVMISLTGEFESFISSDIKEYGINNALVEISINIKVNEQVTMPFVTKNIEVTNKIPIFMSIINGNIPNYYIGGFSKNSNIY